MAVGIIPMSEEMGWDKGTAGLVQSSFFQGFLISQVGDAQSSLMDDELLP